MQNEYATINDVTTLFRPLTSAETAKATALLPIVSAALRKEAKKVGKDLDDMITKDADIGLIAKEITVRAISSVLSTNTDSGDISQFSQSAMGYSISGTYSNPGGGIYFKTSELKRLGLKRQKYGALEMYGT